MTEMLWPNGSTVRPPISSGFGPRDVTQAGASSYHLGCDFTGFDTVHAVADGAVVWVGWRDGWRGGGYMVWVQHSGFLSRSLHLAEGSARVRIGDRVSAGQAIARMGNTAAPNPVGTHLHLEVVVNGSQIDPVPFITARLSGGRPASAGGSAAATPQEDDMLIIIAMNDSRDGTVRKGQAYANSLTAPLTLLSGAELGALDYWATKGIPYRRAEWDGDVIRSVIDVRGVRPLASDSGRSDYGRTSY